MTDAKAITYDLAILFGKPVLYVDMRIDPNSLPPGLYTYDLRHSDDDWSQPATLEKQVTVNYFGTVISQSEMQLDGFLQINEGDFKTDPYETVTLDQFLAGDYELTPSPETEIRVVIVEPLKPPREAVIPNTLEALQSTVEGYIEATYPFADDVVLLLNEEGKVNGLTPNRALWDERSRQVQDIIVGTFIIAGKDARNSSFASLTPEQVKTYMRKFKTIEMYVPMKNQIPNDRINTETER
jgi:hypothetical protein